MTDERRKDPEMRARIDELQSNLTAQQKQLIEDRSKVSELAGRLSKLMWAGVAALVIAALAIGYLGFKVDDRSVEQARLGKENASLVKKLDAEIARSKVQRQKSAANACTVRARQNKILLKGRDITRFTQAERDFLAGPDDCEAYGKSVTTDEVPLPNSGTRAPKTTPNVKGSD